MKGGGRCIFDDPPPPPPPTPSPYPLDLQCFLDETMLYSSAIFPGLYADISGLGFKQKEARLVEAQMAKLDAIISRAQIRPGDHVLEIGCGWGACAIRMGQLGARVTGITLSHEQLAEARARVAANGLSDLVAIELCDYRHVKGEFDKVRQGHCGVSLRGSRG